MPSRIAQLASDPLLTNFAITASQKAIRPVGAFLFPLCEVPDMTFHYKVYTEQNRYRTPRTTRAPGSPATVIGFSAQDATAQLQPNALDFPVPNVNGLSDESLQFAIMEAQSILSDVSALALEEEQINLAVTALTGTKVAFDFSAAGADPIGDPALGLDVQILNVVKAAKNGAPVKVLFGTTAFRKFRNAAKVQSKFIVAAQGGAGAARPIGTISPGIGDVGSLLISNPEVQMSMMVIDNSAPGVAENIQFILDEKVIVFAGNDTPNRMDPSFGKTFAIMGGFFKPGTYTSTDQRDEVLKMDWTTLPKITNTAAAVMIDTTTV